MFLLSQTKKSKSIPSIRFLILVSLLVASSVGCRSENEESNKKEHISEKAVKVSKEKGHHYFDRVEKPHIAHWGYTGETGPSYWGGLCEDYKLAKTGKEQSPIDLNQADHSDTPEITFEYHPASVNLVYNGHTIEEKDQDQGALTVGGRSFSLQQFHFHAPSEHTVNGESYAMEMHLVHKNEVGQVAVVGVFIKEGKENQAFAPLWSYLPKEENKRLIYEGKVDVLSMLPMDKRYYHYLGSFTTPPCTEGVYWYVLKQPVELSKAQIDKFRSIISGNNRPVQPRNGRRLTVTK